jgi:ATP-dependent helicase/nuclease subunit A
VSDERFTDREGRPFDFPLNMEKGLADTLYRADYWKEVFNNWIDQLNAFYVATTRPREALFIYCFKKLKGESDEDLAYHLSNFAGSQLQLQEGPVDSGGVEDICQRLPRYVPAKKGV